VNAARLGDLAQGVAAARGGIAVEVGERDDPRRPGAEAVTPRIEPLNRTIA
jgi:hypothetical protein